MRRAHDPSGLGGRGPRLCRHPQHKAGRARGLGGQCQLAAGNEVELLRLAPDFQHDDADGIAGQRVGGRAQCLIDIGGVDADQKARIEAEFGKSAHRDGPRFDPGKILTDPHQRPPYGHASCQSCDKAGRCRALSSRLRKHLMHGAQSEPALQAHIGLGVSKRHLAQTTRRTMRLDALDAVAQGRKIISGANLMFALLPTAIS
jgi:hypothetical protein